MSPLHRLPTELIIAVATRLDARSLAHFKSSCKVFRDVVSETPSLLYALALAARGLCDGPPSPVTVVSRLELVEAHEEAWRTFSWSKHLTLELPPPHEAPYVSGGTLVLPICDMGEAVRSFVVQSIPSPLRGVPERRWQIDFDFVVMCFVIDATQDLLVVVPRHDTATVLVRALSTGQPHALSANEGVLRLEASQYPSLGNSKHEICGDFLGIITWRSDKLDDRLLIWNWKTGAFHVNMPIRVGSFHDAVFSFLDDRHFVIPSVLSERPGEIGLDVYRFCTCPRPPPPPRRGQQEAPTAILVRSYALSVSDVLKDIRTLRFFPDVSARGGAAAPPGHFYADASRRAFGIQVEATSVSTQRETVQELVVPLRALSAPTRAPPYRRASVSYEPFIGRRLAYASRAAVAGERRTSVTVPPEKLPLALRGVGASRLRYVVCCGALLVFEHANENLKSPRRLHILAF